MLEYPSRGRIQTKINKRENGPNDARAGAYR